MLIINILFFILFVALNINGNEYCKTFIICKYNVQEQFKKCINNSLKLFLETNNFPENFVDASKCKRNAKFFNKLQNNQIITKHNETLACANNSTSLIVDDDAINLKCSVFNDEIGRKFLFTSNSKPTFDECLSQKTIADERCDIIKDCCPSVEKCNSFYEKSIQEKNNNILITKSRILKKCFNNHKIALANPDQMIHVDNKSTELLETFKINNFAKLEDKKPKIVLKKDHHKKKNIKKKKNKIISKNKNNTTLVLNKTTVTEPQQNRKTYKLEVNIARKLFSSWGCNSVNILKALVDSTAKKCSIPHIEHFKNSIMPPIEALERVLKIDQKMLTASCIKVYKELGGKCTDETSISSYNEIGENVQFCRNYDILDSYKEVLDSQDNEKECQKLFLKLKLHLYKLKNCCLWGFRSH
uniref:CPG4 domain-containing protein n=1 Tax=Parastrongyloides trichosuri TaxID=131310 RepID=A0A0N4ZSJ8_PARTI